MMDNQPQIRHRPVIRVFVSSTFTDLKHERDALQRDVFPKLEQLCASRQFQFQAIDLRWGVPTEASLDHRTMRICFEELRRSQEISPQPNFLILLGNRYGWRPLPEEISVREFEELKKAVTTDNTDNTDGVDIREIRALRGQNLDPIAVLSAWFRKDENAVPPVYFLQSRRQGLPDGKDYTQDEFWNEVQAVLWTIINRAYSAAQLAGRFDHLAALDEPLPSIVRFQASATEQEIWRGALGAPNARQHVLAFVREIENVEELRPVEIRDFVDVGESGAINAVARDTLRELKQELRKRLGEGNVIGIEHARLIPTTNEKGEPSADVTTGHVEELCARVHAAFKDIITRQMDEYWGTSDPTVVSPRELELERSEHQRFGQERAPADSFVGRGRHLQAINAYLHGDSRLPLVIHGASGCGKTALLARAAQEIQKSEASGQKPEVVVRFIGVTPRSSDVRSLLASLCQELRLRHPLESPIPGDVRELTKELDEHFKTATAQEPLILFLDALDQLADADNGPSLFWIPFGQLSDHVKLVVSCLSDRAPEDPASQPYTALKRRGLADENFINLDALSEHEAQTLLFERWFPQARRKLNAEQTQCVRERLTSDACRQPLYLKVLFEEARLWRSDDHTPTLSNNVSELIGALFKRLGDPSNHGLTLECALGYIAAARRGLAEMEILEVLYHDPDYAKFLAQMTARTGHQLPDNPKRIPIAIWSRLRFDLAPYLAEHAAPGGTVLNFYHRQLAEFVRGQFLDTPPKRQQRHERLAGYFHDQDFFLESLEEQRARAKRLPPTPRPANVRKVDELPCQQLEAAKLTGKWDDVEKLFTELFFLEAKTEAGMVFDLAADFSAAIGGMPADRPLLRILRLLKEALRRDSHFIARHSQDYSQALFQCLWNAGWWYDAPEAAVHYDLSRRTSKGPLPWDFPAGERLATLLERWRGEKERQMPGFPWLRAIRPPLVPLAGLLTAVLQGHEGRVTSVAFSPDGRRIVSGSFDKSLRVWDAQTGAETAILRGHEEEVESVAFAPDGRWIVSGSRDGSVRVWDGQSGAETMVLRGHEGSVTSVAYSPDGQRIVSGSSDKTVRVWDALTGAETAVLCGHESFVTSVAFSPDGRRIVSGCFGFLSGNDNTMYVWDAQTGAETMVLRGSGVASIAFSPDGRWIVSGSDHSVRVWDAQTGNETTVLRGHESLVESVAFSPDGRKIVSGSSDMTVRVWDTQTGAETAILRGDESEVESVAFSPDGRWIVSGSRDGSVHVWDAQASVEMVVLCGHKSWVSSIAFSPDGRRIVSGSLDKTARLWDAQTGVETAVLRGHARDGGMKVAFSPDGRRIVSWNGDETVRVWDARSGVETALLRHKSSVWNVAFSPDGRRIVSGSQDGTVRAWDVQTGAETVVFGGHESSVMSVAFSPDCRRLVSSSSDKTLRVWDAQTGAETAVLRGHEIGANIAAFSPDGRWIVSGSSDKTLRVWDAQTGAETVVIREHEGEVKSVAFSPDGRRIASESWDHSVWVWDAESFACLEVNRGTTDVTAIAAGPRLFPWLALARGVETVIEDAVTGLVLARFPRALEDIITHPSSRQWAGIAGNHVFYIIALEGHASPAS